jgi:hypothetical protein
MTPDDTRRAPAAFALTQADGGSGPAGDAEAVIDDDVLTVGPVTLAWLDADAVTAADYRITIDCWPGGRLQLSQLGRRFDTFVAALARARNQARVAGLLAHAPAAPDVFAGAILGQGGARPAELQVYPTHVTVVPEGGDPSQVPHGALVALEAPDDPPSVALVTAAGRTVVGQLARRRDAFLAAVAQRRDAQAKLLHEYAGQPGFSDGRGVSRPSVPGFDALVERCSCADRLEGARALLAAAKGGEPQLGFVQLLDPDAEALQAPSALPEDWASFLLVPVGRLVVLEVLAGPSAATYVFEGGIEPVNGDLQALHFRRAGLALTAEQASITPANPHRLALRRLAPLQRLRAATRARLAHGEHWTDALAKAVGAG